MSYEYNTIGMKSGQAQCPSIPLHQNEKCTSYHNIQWHLSRKNSFMLHELYSAFSNEMILNAFKFIHTAHHCTVHCTHWYLPTQTNSLIIHLCMDKDGIPSCFCFPVEPML